MPNRIHSSSGRVPRRLSRRTPCWLLMAFVTGAMSFDPASADEFLRPTYAELTRPARRAIEELIRDLGAADPEVRNRAVRTLAAVGRAAIPPLRDLVREESDPRRLANGCLALAAIGEPSCFAVLHQALLDKSRQEDELRAILVALTRDPSRLPANVTSRVRKLAGGDAEDTVSQAAALLATTKNFGGLPATMDALLKAKRPPVVRAIALIGLAGSGSREAMASVKQELIRSRSRLVRRAALYAVAALADPALLEALLDFDPDPEEMSAYVLALGVYPVKEAVDRIRELLSQEPVSEMAYSLAFQSIPSSLEVLLECLQGRWGSSVREDACLAVTELVDQQRFLPALRTAAESANPRLRTRALLALSRVGDPLTAAKVKARLGAWSDEELLEVAVVFCSRELEENVCEELPAHRRVGRLVDLCQVIDEVRAEVRDPRLLADAVVQRLDDARAHWTLRRDDLRDSLVFEALELGRVTFRAAPNPEPPPEDGGDDGGGDDDAEPPASGGGTGFRAPQSGFRQPGTGPGRGRRSDLVDVEEDLLRWFRDYPLFPESTPFGE